MNVGPLVMYFTHLQEISLTEALNDRAIIEASDPQVQRSVLTAHSVPF